MFIPFYDVDDFEKLFSSASEAPDYPKYNIYSDKDNTNIVLEIGLAGYKKENLSIDISGSTLTIRGNKNRTNNSERKYYRQSLAQRAFTLRFNIRPEIDVRHAYFQDGLLVIVFYETENQKVKSINIQ